MCSDLVRPIPVMTLAAACWTVVIGYTAINQWLSLVNHILRHFHSPVGMLQATGTILQARSSYEVPKYDQLPMFLRL